MFCIFSFLCFLLFVLSYLNHVLLRHFEVCLGYIELHTNIMYYVLLLPKAATLAMSEEMNPTLSVIAPLHAQLLDQMTSVYEDSAVIKELKTAVHINLGSRYASLKKNPLYLCLCWSAKPVQ